MMSLKHIPASATTRPYPETNLLVARKRSQSSASLSTQSSSVRSGLYSQSLPAVNFLSATKTKATTSFSSAYDIDMLEQDPVVFVPRMRTGPGYMPDQGDAKEGSSGMIKLVGETSQNGNGAGVGDASGAGSTLNGTSSLNGASNSNAASNGSTSASNGSTSASNGNTSSSNAPSTSHRSPFPPISLDVSWPTPHKTANGLYNLGNTCFMNSALQVLAHTAPLVRYLEENRHAIESCAYRSKKGFCMLCAMETLMTKTFNRSEPYSPSYIAKNLKKIASHFRLGRQEDSHEFLRFCIEGLQQEATFAQPKKLDIRLKETTYVYQIFGGRLRSRVACTACHHNSDTFESFLDLSIDVARSDSIDDGLRHFVKTDILKGANKYRCEKCKELVIAHKSFRIHEAPRVLTLHLKRFTPQGRKIGASVKYAEHFDLGPYMAAPVSRRYQLYGVINHQGGSMHSGHYTANVRGASGQWFNMNDSSRTRLAQAPVNGKSAYVLFYVLDQSDVTPKEIPEIDREEEEEKKDEKPEARDDERKTKTGKKKLRRLSEADSGAESESSSPNRKTNPYRL